MINYICKKYRVGDRVRAVPSASDRKDLGIGIVYGIDKDYGYVVFWINDGEGGGWDDTSLIGA